MTRLLLVIALIVVAAPAAALDGRLAAQAPAKPDHTVVPPPADPEVIRQGGDTVEDATVIDALPYENVGTTSGFTDDYDWECPLDSLSPDVVYSFTSAGDIALDIDLCGSSYDTKLLVFDEELYLVDCNDDYYFDDECGMYVSALLDVPMMGGETYYIIIDGYGGDYGDYVLSISEYAPCILECPPGGFLEGEPDLVDGYIDDYNGGCNSAGAPWQFQDLSESGQAFLEFCGVAGWYVVDGSDFRDTDWFTAVVGENGFIEVTADAESATYVFELDVPDNCDASVLQSELIRACTPRSMTIYSTPGSVVFLWAGSSNFSNPGDVEGNMYDYILTIDGLAGTATQARAWSQVKGLYR